MTRSAPVPPSRVLALVLASGRGTRMGGPKAMLCWDRDRDETLVEAHVRVRKAECGRIVVVTRHDLAVRIRTRCSIHLVESREPDEVGPAGSIAAACSTGALDGVDVVVLTPVDVPPVRSETVRKLLAAVAGGSDAARPIHDGRRGHPVAVRAHVLVDVYGTIARPPLRDVLRSLGRRCVDVAVDDADVNADLDTPEAFEARTGIAPRFL
jgi:molybdenum cofactor cytidylyltransferase